MITPTRPSGSGRSGSRPGSGRPGSSHRRTSFQSSPAQAQTPTTPTPEPVPTTPSTSPLRPSPLSSAAVVQAAAEKVAASSLSVRIPGAPAVQARSLGESPLPSPAPAPASSVRGLVQSPMKEAGEAEVTSMMNELAMSDDETDATTATLGDVVTLSGLERDDLVGGAMGTFTKMEATYNTRPAYQHSAKDRYLYYLVEYGGIWTVGYTIGSKVVALYVIDPGADAVHLISNPVWKKYVGRSAQNRAVFQEITQVRIDWEGKEDDTADASTESARGSGKKDAEGGSGGRLGSLARRISRAIAPPSPRPSAAKDASGDGGASGSSAQIGEAAWVEAGQGNESGGNDTRSLSAVQEVVTPITTPTTSPKPDREVSFETKPAIVTYQKEGGQTHYRGQETAPQQTEAGQAEDSRAASTLDATVSPTNSGKKKRRPPGIGIDVNAPPKPGPIPSPHPISSAYREAASPAPAPALAPAPAPAPAPVASTEFWIVAPPPPPFVGGDMDMGFDVLPNDGISAPAPPPVMTRARQLPSE